MASVHHLVGCAYNIPFTICKQFRLNEREFQRRQWAAVKIQKVWRGYCVRKYIEKLHRNATIIQKWVRGWLVRIHLPEILEAFLAERARRYYNEMATRIQAWWRGVYVRRFHRNLGEQIRNRKLWEKKNAEMQELMRRLFEKHRKKKPGDVITEEELEEIEREARENVLFVAFKLHHLLRTYTEEGIFSLHGQQEYSFIEKLLKGVRFMDYMNVLHEKYYTESQSVPESDHNHNHNLNEKLAKMEALYKMQETCNDIKELPQTSILPDLHKKPFCLDTYISRDVKFEKSIIHDDVYKRKEDILSRKFDPSENMSIHDFNLFVYQHYKAKMKPPPYCIDFWDQGKCTIHNCSKIFH